MLKSIWGFLIASKPLRSTTPDTDLTISEKTKLCNKENTHIASFSRVYVRNSYACSACKSGICLIFAVVAMFLFAGKSFCQAVANGPDALSASAAVRLEVSGVQDASVSAAAVRRSSPNGNRLYGAYDINVSKDGREWQPEPERPVMVTMTDSAFVDGRLLDIYHEAAGGLEFVATVAPQNGSITFPAHSFSVYIIAEAGDYARLKVYFHRGDGSEVAVYVKSADVSHGDFDRVVYHPGVGTIPSGAQFAGWTANAGYGSADAAAGMTFGMVRDSVRNRLAAGVTDGTELHFYAMLFKAYSVTYLDENNVVIATGEVSYLYDEGTPDKSYTVNAAYTPADNSHKFEGWRVVSPSGSHIAGHSDDSHNYANNTTVTIRGDVVFKVNVSEGHWLIYHENGKGATYKAADFIEAGEHTVRPSLTMVRNGYTFDDWYEGAPASEGASPTGSRFVFGNELDENTHIYANWNPKTTADYTVVVWKQNVEGDGYDFDTAITLSGTVGNNINTVSSLGTGNGRYARINGVDYRTTNVAGHDYTGFHLDSLDQNVAIKTEGNAVLNVYYGRNQHTLRFQIYDYVYVYTATTNNNGTQYGLVNGQYVQLTRHGNNGNRYWTYNIGNEEVRYNGTRYTRSSSNQWQDIKTINALYEQYIGDNFPIVGTNGVTYDNGERWDPQSTAGENDIIVYIDMMPDKDETYHLNEADRAVKTIHYYVEALPDATGTVTAPNPLYDYDNNTVNAGAMQFVEYKTIYAQYRWVTKAEDFFDISGYDRLGANKVEESINNGSDHGYCYNNPDATCTVNFYYTRQKYSISFMDGSYYDGNNNRLAGEVSRGRLETVSNIAYRADVSAYNTYRPAATPAGYVFEGWYTDIPCTQPFTFTTMKKGGITVYAKWRQIQYRVFLHPDADTDPSLDWGNDDQEMNFRVAYGNRVSVPTGTRDDFEFVGWFTNAACTEPFNEDAIVLNESNTSGYDKSTDFTDTMDKWGNGATINKDLTRFWITKKYDLYGKWRAKLRGADGITVVYNGNGGTPASSTDTWIYQDNVSAMAHNASTPSDGTMEFSHWVMQRYNASTGSYDDVAGSHIFPTTLFTVLKANAQRVITQWYNPENPSGDYITTGFDSNVEGSPVAPDATHTEFRATYTVRLRAEYIEVERPEHSFIVWYMNDGTGATVRIDNEIPTPHTLPVNATVTEANSVAPTIPVAPARTGYNFKGWYKQHTPSGSSVPTTVSQCAPNFLYYNNSKYYSESAFTTEVTRVAADLYQSDDYLYAVWEPIVDFAIPLICNAQQITLPTTTTYGVDLSVGSWSWTAATGTVADQTGYTPSDATADTLTFTPDAATCAQPAVFAVTINDLGAKLTVEAP